jgi:hypothetical protein
MRGTGMSSNEAKQMLPGSSLGVREEMRNVAHHSIADTGELVDDEDIDVGGEEQHSDFVNAATKWNTAIKRTPKKLKQPNDTEEEDMDCNLIPELDNSFDDHSMDTVNAIKHSPKKDDNTKSIVNVNSEKTSVDMENVSQDTLCENKEPLPADVSTCTGI